MPFKRICFTVVSIFFILFEITFSQTRESRDKSLFYDYGRRFFAEVHTVPTASPDTVRAIVIFRTANSILSFSRSPEVTATEKFLAMPTVDIEFRDSLGVIRKRETWRDTIVVDSYDKTRSKTDYTYGGITALLPSGNYKVNVNLTDESLNRMIQSRPYVINKSSFLNNPSISTPFFGEYNTGAGPNLIEPFVLDSGMSFTARDPKIFLLVSYQGEPPSYSYKCSYVTTRTAAYSWNGDMNLTGNAVPTDNKTLNLSKVKVNEKIFYAIEDPPALKSDMKIGLLEITLPISSYVPGNYDLYVWNNARHDTLYQRFKVDWENMPLSLRTPEYASEMMYYVLTDEQFEDIKDGNSEEVFNKILNYWKKFDPTPGTVYNEAMAEYFYRVDYAFFNFQTLNEKDGAKTDRGKIYILNGSPNSIDRNLSEGNTQEIWRYDTLKKEFVFEANSSGSFKLKKINQL